MSTTTTTPEDTPGGTAAGSSGRSRLRIPGFAQLQRLGKSLMLPIALLPAAGILLRLGQPDLLGKVDAAVIGPFFEAMSAAGGAIFANLPLLFAVGVAIGFARKADGSTALSAVAGYLVMDAVFASMSPVVLDGVTNAAGDQATINYSVFGGIVVGLLTAWLFDRYHNIQLPSYLGFFGGRRFVPIVVSLASLAIAFGMSYFYPLFNSGLTSVGEFIGGAGMFGAFVYGFVNRMLIPLGLHHIVNTYVWFIYGDYVGPDGAVSGELSRFAAGDPEAGRLTAGFYPILMFGLPGAALAMIRSAKPKQRTVAVGILSAAALTALLTGVTEPLEFAFMFVAFPLYVIHALLTGLSLAIAYALDVHLGFSFSAGLIDLLLYGTAPAAQNVWMLLVMGAFFFVLYYAMFRFAIVRWDMRTPGREPDEEFEAEQRANLTDDGAGAGVATGAAQRARQLIAAFGGAGNLQHVDACITRLRIEVGDKALVDKARLKTLGAAGVIEVGNNVQAIFGTQADALKSDINAVLEGGDPAEAPVLAATPEPAEPATTTTSVVSPVPGRTTVLGDVPDATFAQGLVGHGVAIDPPRERVTAVAPVTGRLVKLWPHAYVILTDDNVGVLVHLGLDTVQLEGEGFETHCVEGERVEVGEPVVTADMAAIEAGGRNPIVPVVVMDSRPEQVAVVAVAEAEVAALDALLTVGR